MRPGALRATWRPMLEPLRDGENAGATRSQGAPSKPVASLTVERHWIRVAPCNSPFIDPPSPHWRGSLALLFLCDELRDPNLAQTDPSRNSPTPLPSSRPDNGAFGQPGPT